MEQSCLPPRVFYSLAEIESLWGVCGSEVRQWIVHGTLEVHVWLPLMSVYELIEEKAGKHLVARQGLRHFEGYVSLSPCRYRALLRQDRVYLREFRDAETNDRLVLPENADDFQICHSDIVILQSERERFEIRYQIRSGAFRRSGWPNRGDANPSNRRFDPSFKTVLIQGREHRFGDIQAAILQRLYQAALDGEPWQAGKRVLSEAGSQSFTISNVFKRNPVWRRLIDSDGRGAYRLRKSFLATL